MVNPKRVVLDEKKRGEALTLFNSSNDTASYTISFIHYEMNEDGTFKNVDSTAARSSEFADSLLRFFPFTVTLAPHSSQTVRVHLMKPKDLEPGEYRTGLLFKELERAKSLEEQAKDPNQKTLSLNVHAIFSIAIPVLVRYQTIPPSVYLDKLTISKPDSANKIVMSVDIHREGNQSCYGTIVLTHKSTSGKSTLIGTMKGIAVYVPLKLRKALVEFVVPPGVDLTQGSLHVEYQTLTDSPTESILGATDLNLASK